MRKVCGIVFLVLAGIFFSAASQFGVVGVGESFFFVLAVMMVPGLVFLLIGVAFMGFRRWKRHAGIVFLSTAGVTAFSLFTMACMLMDDAFRAILEAQAGAIFEPAYAGSAAVLAVFAVLGWFLYQSDPVALDPSSLSD